MPRDTLGPASPVDPDASPAVVAVLDRLRAMQPGPDLSFLLGQSIGGIDFRMGEFYQTNLVELEQSTGATPAIMAIDFGYEDPRPEDLTPAVALAVAHAEAGGLVTASMHTTNPITEGGSRTGPTHPRRSRRCSSRASPPTPGTDRHWTPSRMGSRCSRMPGSSYCGGRTTR